MTTTMKSKEGRVHDAQRFLTTLFHPGSIVEIRYILDGRAICRLFRDMHLAARFAVWLDSKHSATVYYSLNPIVPDSAVALAHKIDDPKHDDAHFIGAKDASIDRRTTYLIDVDPVRPSGCASTDAELESARKVMLRTKRFLTNEGWPEPIELMSGNGFHLLYRGDGCSPNSIEWNWTLKYLSGRFSTAEATIDTSVGNPARISRMPECTNRKGKETEARPHRMAQVLHYPEKWEPLMHSKIYRLASYFGYSAPSQRDMRAMGSKKTVVIDADGVHALIEEFPEQLKLSRVTIDGEKTWFGLSECPFKGGAHQDQNVGKGKSALVLSSEYFGFSCFSDDCRDHSIGDLLRHLHSQTGRWPTHTIWEDTWDIEEAFERMGVQDAHDPNERPMTMGQFRAFLDEEAA